MTDNVKFRISFPPQKPLCQMLNVRRATPTRSIFKTLSDHAVGNSWWSPSSLPAWLDKEFYVQKIQPQLKTVRVRQIAQAMQVSQPYAAFIRSGRRRPHPRHWQALTRLSGTSIAASNELDQANHYSED